MPPLARDFEHKKVSETSTIIVENTETFKMSSSNNLLLPCTSPSFRTTILNKIKTYYRYPLPDTPISTFSVQKTLGAYPHLVVILQRARPTLMFLTRFNGLRIVVFLSIPLQACDESRIDIRATTSLRFANELYNDTLFEGEFEGSGDDCFKIIDIIGFGGKYLDRVNLVRRLNIIQRMLQQGYYRHPPHKQQQEQMSITTARYYDYADFDQAVKEADYSLTKKKIVFKSMHLKFANIAFSTSTVFHPPPPTLESLVVDKLSSSSLSASLSASLLETSALSSTSSDSDKLSETPVVDKMMTSSSSESENDENDIAFPIPDMTARTFWIAKLPRPDTYALYDGEHDAYSSQIAAINSMQVSVWMRKRFHKQQQNKIQIKCIYNKNLKRWVPTVSA